MQSYLVLFGEFSLGKPSHFSRNPLYLELSMKDVTMQILLGDRVQLVMKICNIDRLLWFEMDL